MKPTYEGKPLAAVGPIPKKLTDYPQLWLWIALWEPVIYATPTGDGHTLAAQGFLPSPYNAAVTGTQLYETAVLVPSEALYPAENLYPGEDGPVVQAWYKPRQDGRKLAPVLLTSSIEANPVPTTIPMLNPLPLPQMGEYALVEQDNQLHPYHILALPLEARQRWVALGDSLKKLSEPGMWPPYTERHRIASDEDEYQHRLHSLSIQEQIAIGVTKNDLTVQIAQLRAAHLHLEDLRKALKKETWLQEWQEIQQMAQDLADDYYAHHQRNIAQTDITLRFGLQEAVPEQGEPTEPSTQPEPEPSEPEPAAPPAAEKKRRPRVPKTSIVAKDKELISMSSEEINNQIINGLRDKNTYTPYPDQKLAEYRHAFHKNKGQITITIKPLENEGFETVLHALNTLGDGCIDTYIAITAIALERNGTNPTRIRTPFLISPDDILEVCKKKKSHRSYTAFQRAEVIKHLKTLSQARVIAVMPGPGRPRGKGRKPEPTTIRAEGAIIDLLSFTIGEYSLITGEELWERRDISVGEWATMIPGLSIKTASMLRQVLAYSAKNERYQKRLGVYLTFMFRINAWYLNQAGNTRHATFIHDITMGALLEGSGIVPLRQHGEFREAIERALEELKRDKVIGDYWRVVEDTPKAQENERAIHEHAYGWFDLYLQQKWNFSPPETALNQYRKMLKEAPNGEV